MMIAEEAHNRVHSLAGHEKQRLRRVEWNSRETTMDYSRIAPEVSLGIFNALHAALHRQLYERAFSNVLLCSKETAQEGWLP